MISWGFGFVRDLCLPTNNNILPILPNLPNLPNLPDNSNLRRPEILEMSRTDIAEGETLQHKRARQRKQQKKFKAKYAKTFSEFNIKNKQFFMHRIFSQDECNICREKDNEKDNKMYTLICGHVFHSKCIESWAVKKNTCPVCRNIFYS